MKTVNIILILLNFIQAHAIIKKTPLLRSFFVLFCSLWLKILLKQIKSILNLLGGNIMNEKKKQELKKRLADVPNPPVPNRAHTEMNTDCKNNSKNQAQNKNSQSSK